MVSIRTKLILYVNITIAIMDLISIFLFFVYLEKNEQKSLEKLGISLVSLVSQDNEVRQALSYAQPALLAIPIQRMLSLDGSGEVAYWRMLHADGGLVEENVQGVHLDANAIPIEKEGRQNSPFFPPRIITGSRGKFYHFTAAIFESTPFSEEVFAAQMLDGADVTRKKEGRILGYAQVGLSTRKMNSKILKIIFYSVIPAGLGIFLGGLCITLLLTKHIISPIRRLTAVTQGIARGDLTRKVEVQSEDEIGQLSIHFNQMMESLIEQLRIMAFVKDVGIAINQGDTLSEILQQCAEAIVSNLDAAFARIWTLNEKEDMLELQASAGVYTNKNGVHSRIPVGVMKAGLIARNRIPMVTNDLSNDPYVSDPDWVRREGMVAFAGYPLLAKDRLVGVMGVFARKPIIESMLNALAAAADIIAMGIDRKRAAEALSMSENKYRVLLENLPQRIFYKDINFVYVSCSGNYAKDLNVSPEEIVGKTDYDFYPKELAEKYRTDDKKVIESGQTIDVEEKYVKDEKEFFAHTIKTPLRDEHGAIIGILGVFLDVSEKVALQMEAEHVRHLVSLGELAAGVAHEINNPIMGVINCAQILFDKGSVGSREKDVANRIIKEGKRIASIVSRLLSYARRGEAKESAEIHTLVSEALALSDAQLHKEGILINVNVPQQLPALFVQPQQIQQVFLNLISNARYSLNQKYPGEHAGKTLDISARQISINNSPSVRIDFFDRGMGIPAGILGKIMEPFFTSKPKGKGTGLGLSISHGIISGHGGKLSVESNEGEFTRIIITLPVTQEA